MRKYSLFLAAILIGLTGCGLFVDDEERLDRAEAAIEEGDYRAAIIDTKDVLRSEPDNVRGRLLLGRASVAIGDGAAAEKEFSRAVELGTPLSDVIVDLTRARLQQGKFLDVIESDALSSTESDDDAVEIHQLLGEAYLGNGQPAVARTQFEQVLKADADRVDAKLGIAASFETEKNFLQARSVLDEIVTSHPDDVRGWISYGRLNLRLRLFESAENNFNVAKKLAEESGERPALLAAIEGLANTYLAQERVDEARDAVAELQNLAPTRIETVFLSARLAYLDSNWESAQEYLQSIISAAPEHRQSQMLLGAVHLRSGNLQQAEMYLSTVVAASPNNYDARKLLAETRLLMNKMDEVQATLQPMLSGTEMDAGSLSLAARANAGLGQYETAIGYLKESLEQNPGNVNLQFQLVTTYLNAGRDEEAKQLLADMDVSGSDQGELQKESFLILTDIRSNDLDAALAKGIEATESWPYSPVAYQILGTVYSVRSEPDLARESYYRALDVATDKIHPRRLIASLEMGQENWQAAEDQYLAILELEPEAPQALFALAQLAARKGDPQETIRWLERLRAVDETSIAPRAILARFYLLEGDVEAASDVVEEALRLDDSVAELHNIRGEVLQTQDEFSAAAKSYRRASELDSDNADYQLNYAKSLQSIGDETLAVRALESDMEQTISHIPSAVQLAALRVEAGDLAEALSIAERLAEVHPGSPVPHALMAEVHVKSDDLVAASRAYDLALDIEPFRVHALRSAMIKRQLGVGNEPKPLERYLDVRPLDYEVRTYLAEAYLRTEKTGEAIAQYEKVVAAQPENAVVLNNLAWAYFESGDDKAAQTARRAQQLLPENASVLDTLGWILVNNNSVEEGAEFLSRASELSGGKEVIRYHLAVAMSKAGDTEAARRELEDLLATGNDFAGRADAQQMLARLTKS